MPSTLQLWRPFWAREFEAPLVFDFGHRAGCETGVHSKLDLSILVISIETSGGGQLRASQFTEKCLKLKLQEASTPDWKRQIELFERTFSGQFSGSAECRSLCPMKGPRTGSGYPKASLEGRGNLPTKNAEPEKMGDFKRLIFINSQIHHYIS